MGNPVYRFNDKRTKVPVYEYFTYTRNGLTREYYGGKIGDLYPREQYARINRTSNGGERIACVTPRGYTTEAVIYRFSQSDPFGLAHSQGTRRAYLDGKGYTSYFKFKLRRATSIWRKVSPTQFTLYKTLKAGDYVARKYDDWRGNSLASIQRPWLMSIGSYSSNGRWYDIEGDTYNLFANTGHKEGRTGYNSSNIISW